MVSGKGNIILILAFSLFIIFTLSGCTNSPNLASDPKTAYISYLQKGSNAQQYQATYRLDMGSAWGGLYESLDMNLAIFKKNANKKLVTELVWNNRTMTTYDFDIDGKLISCQNGGIFGTNAKNGTLCADKKTTSQSQLDNFSSFASNINPDYTLIKYDGAKEVAGRACDEFDVQIDNVSGVKGESSSLFYPDSGVGSSTKVKIITCFDKTTGVILNLTVYKLTENVDNSYSYVMSLSANSFSQVVEDSAFDFPIKYSLIGSACNSENMAILIEPYVNYNGPITINILSPYARETEILKVINQSVQFRLSEIQIIQLSHGQESSQNSYEFCLGNECRQDTCNPSAVAFECIEKSGNESAFKSNPKCMYSDPLCEELNCNRVASSQECNSYATCTWKVLSNISGYCINKS